MQEGEQPVVRLFRNVQVVQPVPSGKGAAVEEAAGASGPRPEKSRAAVTEKIGVMELVDRMSQVEAAQQRVARHFRRAKNVAPAVGLDFGEAEQLSHAALEITPDPAVDRLQHPVQAGPSRKRHRTLAYPQNADSTL